MSLHETLITINLLTASLAVVSIVAMIVRDNRRTNMKRERVQQLNDSIHNLRMTKRKPR